MKIVAIIQARMGSSRLPGKCLENLSGKSVLERVVTRTRNARLLNETVVATSTQELDDAIVAECARVAVRAFRGDEMDVLDRYYRAAGEFSAEAIVRITADCPLIDSELIDGTIRAFLVSRADYATNSLKVTYPRGLDVEVFTSKALEQVWRLAHEPYQRAHVTPFFYENPSKFKITSLAADRDYSNHRWTLDTREDLEMIQKIYRHFEPRSDFGWQDVLSYVEQNPQVSDINCHIQQKVVTEG